MRRSQGSCRTKAIRPLRHGPLLRTARSRCRGSARLPGPGPGRAPAPASSAAPARARGPRKLPTAASA
ncbi:MAG: hypothetical protein F4213_16175 [Boseongicola sp. SB0677_bin_26]|nr:hypothetical protein [Boseongicola sp. SB0665_bin_10]MYG27531.1 hypothetical protein [Boseongicola sp. SB0677_bin_26]